MNDQSHSPFSDSERDLIREITKGLTPDQATLLSNYHGWISFWLSEKRSSLVIQEAALHLSVGVGWSAPPTSYLHRN